MTKNKFFVNFSLKKLFGNKKFTVPFSIFTAFVMWLVITINQKPTMERTFNELTANINLENTYVSENGMNIIGDISSQKFTVTVRGPSYIVSSLKSSDLYVYASAASVNTPGEYNLEVSANSNTSKNEYEFLSISPATVKVGFDYVDTKEFNIKAVANGVSASKGLIAENSVVSGTESSTVTIKGPRTVINKIDSVIAYADVNKVLSSSETFDASIILYDEQGEEISLENLTLSTSKVKVTVPISKKATVSVKADFTNIPSGFSKDSIKYSVDHQTVTVIGTPEAIDKITQVTLSAIDITNISLGSKSFDVSAKLPDGVRLLDTIDHFTVTVDMTGYVERTFNIANVRYTGLSSNLVVTSASTVKNVKICGPKSVVNKLNESMLYAELDLSDRAAGEHTVTAKIVSSEYNNIWQVGTYATTVIIK